MSSDFELLHRYSVEQAEDAFAELTRRHVNLVYSAALRQVRSPQLAEEVAQSVFLDLARSAARMKPDTVLPAWLYRVACRAAVDVVRRESRRQRREQLAHELTDMDTTPGDWTQIEPLLDEAMSTLGETERAAVLLRYFEGKTFREVGQALGVSEDAALKRVWRAIERLRQFFSRHGIAVAGTALAALVSAHAVQAAPAGLAPAIANAVGIAPAAAAVVTFTKSIVMPALQKTLATVALVAAVGTAVYEAHHAAVSRAQAFVLRQAQGQLEAQIARLTQEREDAARKIALLSAENSQFRSDSDDLARLRNEVGRLRQTTNRLTEAATNANDSSISAAAAWNDRVRKLKERLAQNPAAQIPELKFVTADDWLNAARGPLDSDDDYRKALATLRSAGENQFIILMQQALQKYLAANNNIFPSDIQSLAQYLQSPDDAAMLDRYAIVPASNMPNMAMGGDKVITVANPVDDQYDTEWALGPNGFGNTGPLQQSSDERILAPAISAYTAAHPGSQPTDPSQLVPYLTTPAQQAAFQRLMAQAASAHPSPPQ